MINKFHYIAEDIVDPRHQISVSVFGVGGTGSFLLSKLARLNVMLQNLYDHNGLHVTAYDFDIIEKHNYVRSTFSPLDEGCNKASTIITRINRYYGLKWVGKDRKFNKEFDKSTNIVFLCVDSLKARKEILKNYGFNGYHDTRYMYCFDIGNDVNHGQIVLATNPNFKKGDRMHYTWELFPDIKDDNKASCSMEESLNSQSLYINEAMAIFAAEFLKDFLLNPKIDYNAVFVNLKEFSISKTFLHYAST